MIKFDKFKSALSRGFISGNKKDLVLLLIRLCNKVYVLIYSEILRTNGWKTSVIDPAEVHSEPCNLLARNVTATGNVKI